MRSAMKLCCGWGWKNSTAPIDSAALNSGRYFGSSQFSPFTTVSSSAPLRPRTVTARSSSSIAVFTSCTGSVASPAKRRGHWRVIPAISSFTSRASARPGGRVEVIAEERRVNRDHLDVDALRVHVGEALLRREAHLGRVELDAPAAADHGAETVAGLVAMAVPRNAGLGRPPQRLRHEMRVNVDRPHDRLLSRRRGPGVTAILTAAACWRPSSTTLSWRIRNFCTLPVTVIGKPSTNFT